VNPLLNSYLDWFIPFEKPVEQQTIIQKHSGQAHENNKIILPNIQIVKEFNHIPHIYKEKRILIDGKSQFHYQLTNIYDVDVTNNFEAEFLVYSSQQHSIHWIRRDPTSNI
jgi:hypothetical protein